jgi:hypothetical protein
VHTSHVCKPGLGRHYLDACDGVHCNATNMGTRISQVDQALLATMCPHTCNHLCSNTQKTTGGALHDKNMAGGHCTCGTLIVFADSLLLLVTCCCCVEGIAGKGFKGTPFTSAPAPSNQALAVGPHPTNKGTRHPVSIHERVTQSLG